MANILCLVRKMRFDYELGMYLRQSHNIMFMTSSPKVGIFLEQQHASFVRLYKIEPVNDESPEETKMVREALRQTYFYNLPECRKNKKSFARLCISYLSFLKNFLIKNKIKLIVNQDKSYLDSTCLTVLAAKLDIPVCYLSLGANRRNCCGVAFQPLMVTEPDTWLRRWQQAESRKIVPDGSVPDVNYRVVKPKDPNIIRAIKQQIRYQLNPFWLARHPDFRTPNSLKEDLKRKILLPSGKKMLDQSHIPLPEEFIFLPLQGNEICHEVKNPLAIDDMEMFTSIVIDALQKFNKNRTKKLQLIVKEHPARPGIISKVFKKKHREITFLCKYPMDRLLEKTKLVLTFNSLSGFEALQKYKPVITFGPLYYTLPGLVYPCQDLSSLPKLMNQALTNGCDRDAVDGFIRFIETHFNTPCPGFSRKNPTNEMFKRIQARIEGILEFAKHHKAGPDAWTTDETYFKG